MEKYIEVKTSYSEKEVRKAISFYIWRIYKLRTYTIIAYTVMFLAAILSLLFSPYSILTPVLLFCGLLFHYFYYIRPVESYLNYYRKSKNPTYRFSDEKVLSTSKEIQSTILWTVFKKAYNIPAAFLLTDENKFVYVLPKNCFCSELDIDEFSKMLIRKTVYYNMCK